MKKLLISIIKINMKTYYIFVAIPLLLTFLFVGTPQFTGKVFVNNDKERKPTDWLSALLLRNEKFPESKDHFITDNVKVIKIIGSQSQTSSYHHIRFEKIKSDNQSQSFSINEFSINNSSKLEFKINQDTLIFDNNRNYHTSLVFYLNNTNKNVVFENVKNGTIHNSLSDNLILILDKGSVLSLQEMTYPVKKIDINDGSNLSVFSCNLNKLELNINNSMVYIDPINNIDSLHANLIGKSNIKLQNTLPKYFMMENYEEVKQNSKVNILSRGNLEYYNLNK